MMHQERLHRREVEKIAEIALSEITTVRRDETRRSGVNGARGAYVPLHNPAYPVARAT